MGWSHPNPNIDKYIPLIDKDSALDMFMDGKMQASNSNFNQGKLDWYNKKYKARDRK